MATNRFIRRLAAILRETADRRAQEWRHEVSEAGWVALPELAAPCSCCHRRALTPISWLTSDGEAAVRFCSDCDRLGAPMSEVAKRLRRLDDALGCHRPRRPWLVCVGRAG